MFFVLFWFSLWDFGRYGPKAQQRTIYDTSAASIVESVCGGYNGTIFAYGQTGAGKTHTMEGYPDPPELRGIIPNAFKHIFEKISLTQDQTTQFLVRASYLEIYNEEIRDLLAKDPKNKLELKESVDSGVYVKDLTSYVVKSVSEIDHVMQVGVVFTYYSRESRPASHRPYISLLLISFFVGLCDPLACVSHYPSLQAGKKNRSVGSTLMNQTSSRSHSIFTIVVETSEVDQKTMEAKIRVGKLNLVDLAGSERQSKTGATGARLKEATKINLSLSALGNVISALVDGKSSHIPYRDSKLTRLLQDSLGGNTKTVMIANCGPADYNYDETISTLRYANRAKNIKNKPKINEDPKDAMLREFQEEIMRLKAQLATAQSGGTVVVDGKEVRVGGGAQVVEKVVEKVVYKESGVSEEKMRELEEKAAKERQDIERKAKSEIERLAQEKGRTEEERKRLEEKLRKEQEEALRASQAKEMLQKKLATMENKLLIGGQLMDKAAKQEAELRSAQIELEERKRQELELARELAEKEEATLLMEEQYSSLQDEVEVKTRKLKKLWTKYQAAKSEIKDLNEEFQSEREDMLDTIRELTRQLKLKQLVLDNFVPPDEQAKLDRRAQWSDENDEWWLPRLEFAGNQLRPRRPVSASGLRRPETEYARHRKQYDNSARFKGDNVINMELEMPDRTTQDYEGAAMSQRVAAALTAALAGDEEEVTFSAPETLPSCNPYLNYNPDDDGPRGKDADGSRRERAKNSARREKRRKRPGTASRRGRGDKRDQRRDRGDRGHGDIRDVKALMGGGKEIDDEEERYPAARGLVSRH